MVSESIQSNQSGVTLPYEKQAMSGGEMPDSLTAPDRWMFLCLRSLYGQKKLGIINRATAVKEKRKLLDQYSQMVFHEEVQMHMVDTYKRVEMLVCEYRKNPSIKIADKVLEALYGGVKRKEPL